IKFAVEERRGGTIWWRLKPRLCLAEGLLGKTRYESIIYVIHLGFRVTGRVPNAMSRGSREATRDPQGHRLQAITGQRNGAKERLGNPPQNLERDEVKSNRFGIPKSGRF